MAKKDSTTRCFGACLAYELLARVVRFNSISAAKASHYSFVLLLLLFYLLIILFIYLFMFVFVLL